MESPFQHTDYKAFLKSRLGPKGMGRGSRSLLAKALGCQTGYISQVLNGETHFSLEQGVRTAQFLKLSENESHYLLLLLQKDRSGTKDLRNYFSNQIEVIRKQETELKSKIKISSEPNEKDLNHYYSQWIYSAIHILVTIPQFQTLDEISQKLNLTKPSVSHALDFLVKTGFLTEKNGRYFSGRVRIHLPPNSPHILKHHTNWRLEALKSLDRQDAQALHYSSILSFGKKDEARVRSIIGNALKEIEEVIKDSPEEELYSLNFDFFHY